MDSYKIKLILIAINVLINIDDSHATGGLKEPDELKEEPDALKEDCVDSLTQFGYDNEYLSLPNFFEFTSRIIFVNGGIKDFEKSVNKKQENCSTTPVLNGARASSELNDAQRFLFKESNNNWAYRYECDMLIKLYENKLLNAKQWCDEFAEEANNGIKNEDLTNERISICNAELYANGLIFENGIHNYIFYYTEHNYDQSYKNYLNDNKSTNNQTLLGVEGFCTLSAVTADTCFIKRKKTMLINLLKQNINETEIEVPKIKTKKTTLNDLFKQKINETEIEVPKINTKKTTLNDLSKQNINETEIEVPNNSLNKNTKKNKIDFLEMLPENYRDEINKILVDVCVAVLTAKGFIRGDDGVFANQQKYYLLKYRNYLSTNIPTVVMNLPPGTYKWCQ